MTTSSPIPDLDMSTVEYSREMFVDRDGSQSSPVAGSQVIVIGAECARCEWPVAYTSSTGPIVHLQDWGQPEFDHAAELATAEEVERRVQDRWAGDVG